IWLVAIASNLSAAWILLANAFMQNPVGYVLRNGRAELDNFFHVLLNPFGWQQYVHTLSGAFTLAGFFVMGVSAYHLLKKQNIFSRVLDMATLNPFDEEAIIRAAKETKGIVTIEEHSINGGLGATVSQIVCANHPVMVQTLGLPDEYLVTGNSLELFAHYGLDAKGIAASAQELFNRISRSST
ncbi:MAG: hypothetical protein EOM15_06165, partial [Spirochaetia bacterium]|nr:hypothetical protein [Spirochaetia bacterium]